MKTEYVLYRPDGTSEHFEEDLPGEPSFDKLCWFVCPHLNGRELERVRVWHAGNYTDMFVGDGSALDGSPRNEAATAIYRANVLEHQVPPPEPESMPAIYGPAVLFLRRVWF